MQTLTEDRDKWKNGSDLTCAELFKFTFRFLSEIEDEFDEFDQ